MPEFYSREQRTLQERFETRKLADLLVGAIVHRFLATVDADGQPTCSYRGGDPGVAHVVDRTTLAFPSYDGNGMFLSLGNVRFTARVGLLFIDLETPHRLRVQGTASVREGDPLLGRWPGADLIVRVAVSAIFVNCSRYVHRYQRLASSRYVPRAGCDTPYAEWKRIDLVQDALPPRDAGKTAQAGGPITEADYKAKRAKGEA